MRRETFDTTIFLLRDHCPTLNKHIAWPIFQNYKDCLFVAAANSLMLKKRKISTTNIVVALKKEINKITKSRSNISVEKFLRLKNGSILKLNHCYKDERGINKASAYLDIRYSDGTKTKQSFHFYLEDCTLLYNLNIIDKEKLLLCAKESSSEIHNIELLEVI